MQITTETKVGIFIIFALSVFAYMTFQIGVFRFDRARYNAYYVCFKDVSGLSRKADVKIAGVKVGWVDEMSLIDTTIVQAKIMVLKSYILHTNSYAVVRQDGLLGNKYLEVVPGDPLLPLLSPGTGCTMPGREAVSIDDILYNVQQIAHHVEDVTGSLKEVLGGSEGMMRLEQTVENISCAAQKMADFTGGIQHFLAENEEHLNLIVEDIHAVTDEFRRSAPRISNEFFDVLHQVSHDVIPEFNSSAQKISDAVDRDFNRIAGKVETAADSLDEASLQVRDGFKNINAIAEKINEGEGLIGKLINEDETYRDIKSSLTSIRNYFSKLESVVVVVDAYSERMNRDADGFNFKNSKGYFNFRVYPNEEHYWLFGITASNIGVIDRDIFLRRWFDQDGCEIIPADINFENERDRLRFAPQVQFERRKEDELTFNAQFAKIFTDLVVRFGLFESSAGIAIDYRVPIPYFRDNLRWISTLEAWDFNGRRRIDDERLHVTWLNRIFFSQNLYFTFGADDFASKDDKNAFFGVGIRFIDDDIKYLLSRIVLCV